MYDMSEYPLLYLLAIAATLFFFFLLLLLLEVYVVVITISLLFLCCLACWLKPETNFWTAVQLRLHDDGGWPQWPRR